MNWFRQQPAVLLFILSCKIPWLCYIKNTQNFCSFFLLPHSGRSDVEKRCKEREEYDGSVGSEAGESRRISSFQLFSRAIENHWPCQQTLKKKCSVSRVVQLWPLVVIPPRTLSDLLQLLWLLGLLLWPVYDIFLIFFFL